MGKKHMKQSVVSKNEIAQSLPYIWYVFGADY